MREHDDTAGHRLLSAKPALLEYKRRGSGAGARQQLTPAEIDGAVAGPEPI
jgi:hypothetical protein